MHERSLRTVLLIQAIEESDRAGEVIPLADRADATRSALRSEPEAQEAARTSAVSAPVERFLVRRAGRLREHLAMRSPVVERVLALAGGTSWLGAAVLAMAFASGVSLAALDGSRRIDVLAFPLLGLILWNLVVYAALAVTWLRGSSLHLPRLSPLYARWIGWRADALLRRSARFNAPLAAGLRRFAHEWAAIARPLLVQKARRLFHLAAALVAAGLIAGLYVRGVALRYEAGWESTFLGPEQVHALLRVLYGPAAALAGIALPDSPAELAALRWTAAGGGAEAAIWIHLIAATAVLYIVAPRLLAALLASIGLWRSARRPLMPAALSPYARGLLLGANGATGGIASLIPYAYEPSADATRGAEALLSAALGGAVRADMRDPVRYGDEEAFVSRLAHGAARVSDWNVLLVSLASTPEAENHGVVIAGLRDWTARSERAVPLVVIVDESAYAARMQGDTSFERRLQERRKLWTEFVAGYGLRACSVHLASFAAGSEADRERIRDSVRTCLWTPGQWTAMA